MNYVQRFIAFGGEPLPVPDEEIFNVQQGERNQLSHTNAPRLVEIMLMDDPRKRSIAMLNYITEKSLTHKMKRKKNDCYQKKDFKQAQAST